MEYSQPQAVEIANQKGRKLFERIKKAVCTNKEIRNFFTGDKDLQYYLKIGIPVILALVSPSLALGPLGLAIAVIIISLILKVGYEVYCEAFIIAE